MFHINVLKLWVFLYDGVFDKETVEYRWDAYINS